MLIDERTALAADHRLAAQPEIRRRAVRPRQSKSITLSDGRGHGERTPIRRYLKPDFRCLRCNRRELWASARTRYLKCVFAAAEAT